MKKIFNIIISTLLLSLLNFQTTYAYDNETYGNADVLKITMRKVELCTGFQTGDFDDILTDAFCNNAVVIGSGDKEVDIASVDAGASAAAYGQPTLLPLGETYTHLRVTIDKKFTLKSDGTIDTGSASNDTDFCVTKKTTDAMYGGGTGKAGKKYTHKPAIDPGADANAVAEEMDLYWVNGRQIGESGNTFTHCYNNSCGQNNTNWSWGYDGEESNLSGLANTHVAMSVPRASVVTDDLVLVYALSKPYTVTTQPPSIDIAFSTQDGILAAEASNSQGSGTAAGGDGMCAFTIGKVFVKITISEKRARGGTWR
jgi:hypothetical protein